MSFVLKIVFFDHPLIALSGDEFAAAKDVAVQDSASFTVPQFVVDVLEQLIRVDLRLEVIGRLCRRSRRRKSVVGLTCRCIIFEKCWELVSDSVGRDSSSVGHIGGMVGVMSG